MLRKSVSGIAILIIDFLQNKGNGIYPSGVCDLLRVTAWMIFQKGTFLLNAKGTFSLCANTRKTELVLLDRLS